MLYQRKMFALMFFLSTVLSATAQGVDHIKTMDDGTRVITTTLCRYAKGSGVFGKARYLAMSHITYNDGDKTYAIVMRINSKNRYTIGTGRKMVLNLQNGTILTLPNVRNIGRVENHEEFDHTYTVLPEYAVTDEQLAQLSQFQVISIMMETDEGTISIDNRKFTREWTFNRMVQRCHNVLKWKVEEIENPK